MVRIRTEDEFDLDRIADSGQCFRWEKLDGGAYRIVHRTYCTEIRPIGQGEWLMSCDEPEYEAVWYDYFDFGVDYRAVRARVDREADPFLFRACEAGRGIRILRQDPWETLISFIISQNRNIPAIRKSVAMLCEAAGREMTDAQGRPYRVFPEPEDILALDGEALAACKLGYRCASVRAAAEEVSSGRLDLDSLTEADETTALARLMSVHGVGVKVANCVSLFGLHHLDAFPVDVWIRRVLAREYTDGYPIERYRPYNGIYQQYMFNCYRNRGGG